MSAGHPHTLPTMRDTVDPDRRALALAHAAPRERRSLKPRLVPDASERGWDGKTSMTFRELVRSGYYAPFVKREIDPTRNGLIALELDYHRPVSVRRCVVETVLSVQLSAVRIGVKMGNRNRAVAAYGPGTFDLSPPNTHFEAKRLDPGKTITIALPQEAIAESLGGSGFSFDPLYERPHYSDLILALARQMTAVTDPSDPDTALHAETVQQMLIVELARLSRSEQAGTDCDPLTLTDAVLRLLEDYIDGNLGEKITIDDLARVAGCPIGTFSRRLKRSTGKSPYQLVVGRRLIAAQEQILSSRTSLARISFECGFSSQSHMTQMFRKKLGLAPGQLRKDTVMARRSRSEREQVH